MSSYAKEDVAPKWEGDIPEQAQSPEQWVALTDSLIAHDMGYGALAASSRMLMFFQDLKAKETGFKTIVELIDRGYPYSTEEYFRSGDIDPKTDDSLVFSYNLYKFMINEKKKIDKWAQSYLAKVEKTDNPKFLFYTAVKAYSEKDLEKAKKALRDLLSLKVLNESHKTLVKKAARTLARIYFEEKRFEKALDIYESFLLKTNPVTPNDWVETAWTLYHLKRYPEALGVLFNLKVKIIGGTIDMERYILRSFIHKDLCDSESMEKLMTEFDREFGDALFKIKNGESLKLLPELVMIKAPRNDHYLQVKATVDVLRAEQESIDGLPGELNQIAAYLYQSEIKLLERAIGLYEEQALQNSAQYLVVLSEKLQFQKFQVMREKFNPDAVFIPREKANLVDPLEGESFLVRWWQDGVHFWRDERPKYRGVVVNQCAE